MTETLETKTQSYKMKPWEMIAPVVGTVAYCIRCGKDVNSPDIPYSNKIAARVVGLISKDIFMASAAAMLYILNH